MRTVNVGVIPNDGPVVVEDEAVLVVSAVRSLQERDSVLSKSYWRRRFGSAMLGLP